MVKKILTTGAGGGKDDINQATNRARAMVTKYGMSEEMGPVEYGENRRRGIFRKISNSNSNPCQKETQKIDKEIRKIVDEGYNQSKKRY